MGSSINKDQNKTKTSKCLKKLSCYFVLFLF